MSKNCDSYTNIPLKTEKESKSPKRRVLNKKRKMDNVQKL
jgi:hypothetical protein